MSGGGYTGQASAARRASAGALLGVASGAVAWGLAMLGSAAGLPGEWLALTLPGAVFGLAAGLALWRLGRARAWQAALFAALSLAAWPAGVLAATEYYLDPRVLLAAGDTVQDLMVGLAGGAVWAALQALGAAAFPFARRPWLLAALLAAGTAVAGIVTAVMLDRGLGGDDMFLVLWAAWYGALAAIAGAALPRCSESPR